MRIQEKVIEYIRSTPSVLNVMVMDDETSNAVLAIEHSVKTRMHQDYKNMGYDLAMEREHRLCVFVTDGYMFEKRTTLKLMTTDGTIMGTTLLPEEIPEYRKREDLIWISEDFVVFPDIIGKGEEAFVLYPTEIPEISEAVPECTGAISVSPTPSSDAYLKELAGIPLTKRIFTSIIAFDEQ